MICSVIWHYSYNTGHLTTPMATSGHGLFARKHPPYLCRRVKENDVSPKRPDNEKKNSIGISRSVGRRCGLRPRSGAGRHQRSNQPHDLVLRPGDQAVLRHRRGARPRRRHKDLQQVLQRRPGHVQDSRLVVFRLHLPDRCGDNPPFLLPLSLWSTP